MRNKAQQSYIAGVLNDIIEQIRFISSSDEEEAIHKLRVNFKKLRAWLRAAGMDKAIPAALKKMYYQAGAVRDYMLYKEQLRSSYRGLYAEPYEYLSGLELRIYKQKQKLLKIISGIDVAQLKRDVECVLPDRLNKKNIRSFTKDNISEIKELTKNKHPDKKLHEIRKRIKDVNYILEITGKSKNKKLNKIASTLGEYNDLDRFRALSKKMKPKQIPDTEKKLFQIFRKEWKNKSHELKEKYFAQYRFSKRSL
jgi:CHAD domain-containing protein